jgi:uncharacterized protein YcbK (DUF882 family)
MCSGRVAAASNVARRAGIGLAALVAVMGLGIRSTQDAVANGDTRTLTFLHNNTKEELTVTFRRNGQYVSSALEQLNWFMRDWRRAESTRMDPRLFDTIWEVYREVGSNAPVQVNSAYRSPNTNSMLRRRSSAVAKNSQHMQGKALDFYLSDVSASQLRAIGMRLQNGGVGYYPNAYTPFVHLDVGSVRSWPRMTRDQLSRIFPDGRTVHIPADGNPLPGYEVARAEVLARGGQVAGYRAYADAEEVAQPRRKSFWATLFGGSDEDEDVEEIRANSRPGRQLFASRAPQPDPYANPEASTTSVLMAYNDAKSQPAQRAPAPRAEAPRQVAAAPVPETVAPALREEIPIPPAAPTRIAGLPSTVPTPGGPSLTWQQGPAAQGGDMKISRDGTSFAPTPPRRPGDLAPVAVASAVVPGSANAYAPLPPARPGALAAGNPILAAAELRGSSHALVNLAGTHPMPPARPNAKGITVASAGPIELPASALPLKPSAKPEKGKNGKIAETTASIAPKASAPKAKVAALPAKAEPKPLTKAAEGRLVAKPEIKTGIKTASKAEPKVEPKPVAKAEPKSKADVKDKRKPGAVVTALTAPATGLNMGFTAKPMGDLATNRFTGPAVKALPVVR